MPSAKDVALEIAQLIHDEFANCDGVIYLNNDEEYFCAKCEQIAGRG